MLSAWTTQELLLAWGIVAAGALIQGAVGLGMGLVAVPVLLLIDPVFVPGPMLGCALALTFSMIMRERRSVDLLGLKWGLLGRLVGTAIASLLMVRMSQDVISVASALLVLVAVVLSLSGWRLIPNSGVLLGVGTVSGIMSTFSSVGGPPIALLYQDEEGPRLRATLSGYLIFGSIVSLVGLVLVGRFGRDELIATAFLLPAVAAGFVLSGPALSVLDRGYTRKAVLLISAVTSASLLLKTLG